jgi:hypothetical protein
MLKAIVRRGAPTMANDVLRWVKRMFDYAIKRQMIHASIRRRLSIWRTLAAKRSPATAG